jgi:ABC-type multidrug transport system ATPase subunit
MLQLKNISKSYNYQTIFKALTIAFAKGEKWAILGQNGSGKSTLLKIIASLEALDEGEIIWDNQLSEERSDVLRICAPYTQPLVELSTLENLTFASQFSAFRNGLNVREVFNLLPEDKRSENKPLKQLSSGMLQRVKLLLAVMADVPMLILDEPLSNLDIQGHEWYVKLVEDYLKNTLVLVGSNDPKEYSFCSRFIEMAEVPLQHGTI